MGIYKRHSSGTYAVNTTVKTIDIVGTVKGPTMKRKEIFDYGLSTTFQPERANQFYMMFDMVALCTLNCS